MQPAHRSEAQLVSYDEFKKSIGKHLARGGKAHADGNNLILEEERGGAVSLSLDKLYRFYIDDVVSNPGSGEEDRVAKLQAFIDAWRTKTGREALFRVQPARVEGIFVIEQCCIR